MAEKESALVKGKALEAPESYATLSKTPGTRLVGIFRRARRAHPPRC